MIDSHIGSVPVITPRRGVVKYEKLNNRSYAMDARRSYGRLTSLLTSLGSIFWPAPDPGAIQLN